jgi:glycerophosphoryl diester phosphodiesterase
LAGSGRVGVGGGGSGVEHRFAVTLRGTVVEHRPTRVTAPRGSKAAPENSLAALKRALAAGADCVEIDVQQTADGQVVLMHDRDLRRMAGDPRDVNDVTLADLRPLRLTPSGGADDEPIPRWPSSWPRATTACGSTSN